MSFTLPSNLQYSSPESVNAITHSEYLSFQPQFGNTFTPGQNIRFVISSPNGFLDVNKTYISYDMKGLGGGTQTISYLGGVSAIKQIKTSVSGLEIDDLSNYNLYMATLYDKLSASRKTFLKATESYQIIDGFATGTNPFGRQVCHALTGCSLFAQGKSLPIAFMRSGITLDITLESALNVAFNALTTGYEITNVRFNAHFIYPTSAYLKSFQETLNRNSIVKMPLRNVRNFSQALIASNSQSVTISPGLYGSVRSVLLVMRKAASINVATTDAFNSSTGNNLVSYSVRIDNKQFPSNYNIQCTGFPSASKPYSNENIMIMCNSVDNDYSHLSPTDNTVGAEANSRDAIFIDLTYFSNLYNSGVPLEAGQITFNLEFDAVPLTTDVVDLFVQYDAELQLDSTEVNIIRSNL